MPKHFQAQNIGGSKVFSGIVSDGVAEGTWKIICPNGIRIFVPKGIFTHLQHDDQPSIVLSFIVTKLVEVESLDSVN